MKWLNSTILASACIAYFILITLIWQDYRIVNQETLAQEAVTEQAHMTCLQKEIELTLGTHDLGYMPSVAPPPRKP